MQTSIEPACEICGKLNWSYLSTMQETGHMYTEHTYAYTHNFSTIEENPAVKHNDSDENDFFTTNISRFRLMSNYSEKA